MDPQSLLILSFPNTMINGTALYAITIHSSSKCRSFFLLPQSLVVFSVEEHLIPFPDCGLKKKDYLIAPFFQYFFKVACIVIRKVFATFLNNMCLHLAAVRTQSEAYGNNIVMPSLVLQMSLQAQHVPFQVTLYIRRCFNIKPKFNLFILH